MSDIDIIQTNKKEDSETETYPPSEYRREIKTYVLRAGRMTAAQEKAYFRLRGAFHLKKSELILLIFLIIQIPL